MDETAEVKGRFLEIMTSQIASKQGLRLLEAASEAMTQGSVDGKIGLISEGFPVPLGWMKPERPYSYEHHNFTREDLAFVVGECRDFTRGALDVAFSLEQNQYNGETYTELTLADIKTSEDLRI